MNYLELSQLRDKVNCQKGKISQLILENFEKHFEITYTHDSTAMEGNTLTLIETKAILEDHLSIGGKPLREIYEIVNHSKAFTYIKKCIYENKPLTESIAKDSHALLMENIMVGGIYRDVAVRITGASHKPPAPSEMFFQVKDFFKTLPEKSAILNAIDLAAYTHAEFVKIHPFEDGNGRTSRLLMNYQLMANGFLPISISKDQRLSYYNALEEYAVYDNLEPFSEIIFLLEHDKLEEYLTLVPSE